MEITNRDRFWMHCKVIQVWRFAMLNLRILRAAAHGTHTFPQSGSDTCTVEVNRSNVIMQHSLDDRLSAG